ncbi:Protein GVQW1 [Plecturocebus cupreus]
MGFCHVDQAALKLLTSGDLLTSASQSAGITGVSHCAWPRDSLNMTLKLAHGSSRKKASLKRMPCELGLELPALEGKVWVASKSGGCCETTPCPSVLGLRLDVLLCDQALYKSVVFNLTFD